MSEQTCPKCGRAVCSGALHALCASCLLETVLGDDDERVFVTERAGSVFGDYEILAELAHGGMGIVYKARQSQPNRLVALKMLHGGQFAGADELQRFRTEADAAANLNHPNIVPVYEVGEHMGQQYFTMKLIEGGSLADVVKEGKLRPLRDSAQFVATVARAVHCAHQHGILHRDLKPANILIDAQGQPHVADFGLAKNTKSDSDLTLSGKVIGTPSYMAPEQAIGNARDASTAADVYSLGAILYQLITGRAPFEGSAPVEILRKVTDTEPVRPRALNSRIDRDLETICLKCLEKNSRSRYGSAEALAEDLDRWLRREPILARPVSLLERGWKWAQRRPALAALGCTTILALFAIAIVSTALNIRLSASEKALLAEAEKTRRESEKNRRAASFLKTMIERDWVAEAREGDMRIFRDALARTGRRLGELSDQPETQIEVGLTLARIYQQLGLFEEQAGVSSNLVEQVKAHFGPKDRRVADALDLQGYAFFVLSLYEQSIVCYRGSIAVKEEVFGPGHELVAGTCVSLSHSFLFARKFDEAEVYALRAVSIQQKLSKPTGSYLADALQTLGRVAQERGSFDESEKRFREAVEVQKRIFGESHIFVADAMRGLASLLHAKGDLQTAEKTLREALAIRRQDSGPWRHQVATILSVIGHVQVDQGNLQEAEKSYREAYEIDRNEFGQDHQFPADHLAHLGRLQVRRGQLHEAESSLREALTMREKALGAAHQQTVQLRAELADLTQRLKAN